MPTPNPIYVEKMSPFMCKPGVQKDGTLLASRFWTDSQHCRFQRGLPRKMGGYTELATNIQNVPRGTFLVPNSPYFNVYVAQNNSTYPFSLEYLTIDKDGTVIVPLGSVDRTPPTLAVNVNNDWQFDSMFSTTDDGSILIAFAAPNLDSIDSTVEKDVFYGESLATTPLTSTGHAVSGGIVVLHPYLFLFGNAGHVQWTAPNDPLTIQGDARVSAEKVVAGIAVRGGNSSPAGLFWTLNNLIRCTFTGPPNDFTFDTISDETSILSAKSVIEYDGLYFWVAIDRFCVYNGTVKEVPNDMVLNWFFDNLNFNQRQKVWATKVPRFGEIWWYFPFGESTECNAAVVYNVRENTWYPTTLSRSCGIYNQVYQYPLWLGDTINKAGGYSVWEHEVGYDEVFIDNSAAAIDSYIQTCVVALPAYGPSGEFTGMDRWSEIYRYEPDLIQRGDMTLTVSGRQYANSVLTVGGTYPMIANNPIAVPPILATTKIDIREQYRQMLLKFESNTLGGYYEFGLNLNVFRVGDARQ